MNNKKKKNMLPALAMAGPVSVWMILFEVAESSRDYDDSLSAVGISVGLYYCP